MLCVTIPAGEFYDEANGIFIETKTQILQLEHSLVSLSKWEAKWKKPFLGADKKTVEETNDYIRCMTLTQNVNSNVYKVIPGDVVEKVMEYIDDPMTATWFRKGSSRPQNKIMTAERFYSQMISLNIPFECQKWHLNRLITLIRVCSIENIPQKNMSRNEIYKSNREINAMRRKRLHSKG